MNGEDNKRKPRTLSIDDALYANAQTIAKKERRDVSSVFELALEEYIKSKKSKRRPLAAQ